MKTNQQDCFPFGEVYFFKNGTVQRKSLTLAMEDYNYLILQYGEKGNFLAPISTEEQANSISKTKRRSKKVAYQTMIENGYAVIRIAKYLEVSKNHIEKQDKQTVEAYIPPRIGQEDATNVQQFFERQEQLADTIRSCVTNFLEQDFDYYNPMRISEKNGREKLPSATILAYYLREKLGQLTLEEQIMFDKYRKFNLEEILTCQNQKKYPINHADSGVILITANQCFKQTVKKMQHNPELFFLQEKAHPTSALYGKELSQRLEQTADIMIYLMHQNIFCFLPTINQLTDFQKTTMMTFLDEVKQIQNKYSKKVFIDAEEQNYITKNYYSVEELQTALYPKKKKLFTKRKKKQG